LVVTAAAAALVTSLALSADASGGDWLRLGGHNDASSTTTVDNNGRGPALRLATRPASPPLAVTSPRRVGRLNADMVDGMHAEQLRTRAYVYRIGGDDDEGPWVIKSFPGLPSGYYVATYRVVASFESGTEYSHDMSVWFTTATQPKAGQSSGHQREQLMTLEGSAYVDGRTPFTFRINSAEAFSTLADSSNDRLDSRITFVRVAPMRSATTTYSP
jgi:hypothetical protein